MKWLEDKQMLISLAKDKTLKVWKFPKTWIDETQVQKSIVPDHSEYVDDSSSDEEADEKPREEKKEPKLVVSQKKKDSDSDDDLTGWDN